MPNLDMLLLKGPTAGVEQGLNEIRFQILAEGIPANSEGMVRPRFRVAPRWFRPVKLSLPFGPLLVVDPDADTHDSLSCACTCGSSC